MAARISREVLAVWLWIHLRRKLSDDPWIMLPGKQLEQLRLNRVAKHRALKALQAEGLIRTYRTRGSGTRVRLVRTDLG
jgi:hypothetical protein